jgi:YjbE family integral membrane protein
MTVEWLPIKLAGGILLLFITWNLIKDNNGQEGEQEANVREGSSFMKAVGSIILADVSMSLDNVLAIGGTANGHVGLIVFGIALNIPILFFGSQLVANLMDRFKIVVYIGGAVLMRTAAAMIMEDHLITGYINHGVKIAVPWVMAVIVLLYGLYKISGKWVNKSVKAGSVSIINKLFR